MAVGFARGDRRSKAQRRRLDAITETRADGIAMMRASSSSTIRTIPTCTPLRDFAAQRTPMVKCRIPTALIVSEADTCRGRKRGTCHRHPPAFERPVADYRWQCFIDGRSLQPPRDCRCPPRGWQADLVVRALEERWFGALLMESYGAALSRQQAARCIRVEFVRSDGREQRTTIRFR
jgi:hypothetical protein